MSPAGTSDDCVSLSTKVLATFHVNLGTGRLEAIDIDLAGYEAEDFEDLRDELSPDDLDRAAEIAAWLGHFDPAADTAAGV